MGGDTGKSLAWRLSAPFKPIFRPLIARRARLSLEPDEAGEGGELGAGRTGLTVGTGGAGGGAEGGLSRFRGGMARDQRPSGCL